MQKDKLNIKDIVEKLKEIELKSHKSDVPTSIYDNLILYLESQNLRQNIIKDDSNNVFRAFSDALNKGQLNYKPIKEKLVEKLHESHNQLKHILKLYLEIDPEDYLDRLDIASVDPMIELGFLLQIYNKNLRLFYFYEDSSLMEIKLPASSADAEYITLFYFKSMLHTVKDVKSKTEETKINLATFNKLPKPTGTVFESSKEEGKIDHKYPQFDIKSGTSSSKSKSSVFASNVDIVELAASKRTPVDRKANYRKKGMSSTSGAFLPPSKESKPLSPPPGFDPLPTKPQSTTMKSGFSSSVVHTNQSLFTPIQSYPGAMSLAPQMMGSSINNNEIMQPMDQPKIPMVMSNVRPMHDDIMPSYGHSASSNFGSMTMMGSSHMNRMPSGTLPQTAKPSIYSIPMIRSEVINKFLI